MNLVQFLILFFVSGFCFAAPPSLPAGLGSVSKTPSLPKGLLPNSKAPKSLMDDFDDEESDEGSISGFVDYRIGVLNKDSGLHNDNNLKEARLRLNDSFDFISGSNSPIKLKVAADLLLDANHEHDKNIYEADGTGQIDLRKLSVFYKASDSVDVLFGRQILTWGTGDFVFLNDFFPKDWRYWLGRDSEYSKAPSDAIKVSVYNDVANLDIVYTPQFNPDRFINGSRFSFFNASKNSIVGEANAISTNIPNKAFSDDELAIRLYKTVLGTEYAAYAYSGFYKSPSQYDVDSERYGFSRLASFGLSLRKPVGVGVMSFETAYWDSVDDASGDDTFIKNGETRWLLGFEWEAAEKLNVGLQLYSEIMHHFSAYQQSTPNPNVSADKKNNMLTVRLRKQMMSDTLTIGLFSFYNPSNHNIHLRPEVKYQVNDQWLIEVGANYFGGDKNYQPLAQFENNNNIYFAVRYIFGNNN